MKRPTLSFLLIMFLLASPGHASVEIPVTRETLHGARWSYTIEYDQSMEGRAFYDHAGRDSEGAFLLRFSIHLKSGNEFLRTVRSEDEEDLYAQAAEMDGVLDDVQKGKKIPIGHGSCEVRRLYLRLNGRRMQTIEKWSSGYDIVPCM